MNLKIIQENDIINKYPFFSNHYFNCVYKYKNKFAIAEFNQSFSNSIILKTKYYNSADECLLNYNFKEDTLFVKLIINKI